jgi:hypothetical protein
MALLCQALSCYNELGGVSEPDWRCVNLASGDILVQLEVCEGDFKI